MSGLVLHLVAMLDHGVNSDWWNGSGMVVVGVLSGSCDESDECCCQLSPVVALSQLVL